MWGQQGHTQVTLGGQKDHVTNPRVSTICQEWQCGHLYGLPEDWCEVSEPLPTHMVPQPSLTQGSAPSSTPDVSLQDIQRLIHKFKSAVKGDHVDLQGLDLASVLAFIPPVHDFQAAAPATVVDNWQAYFALAGPDAVSNRVLTWVSQGFKPTWVHAFSSTQQAHPKFHQNMAVVSQQVAQVVGPSGVNSFVDRNKPAQIHFPNRKSAVVNTPFVMAEIQQALQRGAVKECDPQELVVVNGLGVVGDPEIKARLVVNAMYVNLFVKYTPFHYQSLRDVPLLAKHGDVIMVTDFKSGYHHVPLHPSVQKYFGFHFQGRFFCFTVLPFGLASGCWAYTQVVQAVMRPLEDIGVRCIKFIDDVSSFFQQGPIAIVGRALLVSVFRFLRLALTASKCDLQLQTAATFLGLVCDVGTRRFMVPQAKRENLLQLIQVFLDKGGSKRDLARLAGKFVSIAPAVQLAPLYIRRLFQAMTATQGWDDTVGPQNAALAREDLLYFRDYLQANPGWTWDPRTTVVEFVCAGDASETGYGGHSDLLPRDFVLPFSAEDQARMAQGQLSSTLREVKNACFLVSTCIMHNPSRIQGVTITCLCDNLGAVANINKMRGSPEEVNVIRDMWILASKYDVQVRVEWRPRESKAIQEADTLSRVEDLSDYTLCFKWTQRIMRKWGTPTGDAFAGPWAHSHKAPRFFTASPCHVGDGYDATIRDWGALGSLVWVFPPVWLLREAISKILMHRCSAILLVASLGCHQWPLLHQLPIKASLLIPPHEGMFLLGSKYPKAQGSKPFMCTLHCFRIQFDI
jgi:hypothetical protein